MSKKLHDKLLPMVFAIIDNAIKIYSRNYCKIHAIDKNKVSNEYLITFFYLRKRQLLVKAATEIFQDKQLLNQFNVLDASTIGLCVGKSHYTRVTASKLSMK